ncbi:MAG: enoyl-CoA hydratase/isomerase family protein [Actinomycetota bacterium]
MDFETLLYEEKDGVAWVTLNRPDVHNAFNSVMMRELSELWTALRANDDVRVAVLSGAGEKAFCTGIDRAEGVAGRSPLPGGRHVGSPSDSPFMFDDPGDVLGPKTNDLWKPVIAAVNGMACGGAFYLLGECDIIIASENATFFDPHTTYGMTSSFESMHMVYKMPFGEVVRMQLLGNDERLSAQRAHQIGLVSEVVAPNELRGAAQWLADRIAAKPPLAVEGTLRALWAAKDLPRSQALALGYAFVKMGTNAESIKEGQRAFESGERPKWRLR